MVFGKDTVNVKPPDKAAFLKKQALVFADDQPQTAKKPGRGGGDSRSKFGGQPAAPSPTAALSNVKTISQNPKRPLELVFNRPVAVLDTTLIKWTNDSLKTVFLKHFSLKKDSISPRKWLLENQWQGGKNLRMTILPGALTDIFGEKNRDTLRRQIVVLPEKQLGSLNITFKDLDVGKSYLFELLNGETVVERRSFQVGAAANRLVFAALPVGQYGGRLTEDINGNGRWDTGSFEEKRLPEVIFSQKFETLKADWEQEVEFSPGVKGKFRGGGLPKTGH